MHSLIILNKADHLLTNSITWADNRAKKEVQESKKSGLANQIYQKNGIPIHPMAPVYKILWYKKNKPEIFKQAAYFISIKAYLIYRLTGQIKEEITMASATGLLNKDNLDWDQTILEKIGITKFNLPSLVQPTDCAVSIKKRYVQKLCLSNKTKIVLSWAKNLLLSPDSKISNFLSLEQEAVPGSNGLLFHPYIGGERAPLWIQMLLVHFFALTGNTIEKI